MDVSSEPSLLTVTDTPRASTMTLALIDGSVLSQETLIKTLETSRPHHRIIAYLTPQSCIDDYRSDICVIVFYVHGDDNADGLSARGLAAIREAFPNTPLVVLSDAKDAHQSRTIRSALNSGAHGFIPTRTTGVAMTLAAIHFVKEGGTFAPLDLLLAARTDRAAGLEENRRAVRLTERQDAVLMHMKQGSANKTIAYELGMSEHTVKVHVRNIMRKVGATNRTQAVYKVLGLQENAGISLSSDL